MRYKLPKWIPFRKIAVEYNEGRKPIDIKVARVRSNVTMITPSRCRKCACPSHLKLNISIVWKAEYQQWAVRFHVPHSDNWFIVQWQKSKQKSEKCEQFVDNYFFRLPSNAIQKPGTSINKNVRANGNEIATFATFDIPIEFRRPMHCVDTSIYTWIIFLIAIKFLPLQEDSFHFQ